MDNLFKAQVRFNGGNPYLLKGQIDATIKDLKDQLNEINQGPILEDTRRVGGPLVRTSQLFADRKDNADKR
jgi:hypothetical protein